MHTVFHLSNSISILSRQTVAGSQSCDIAKNGTCLVLEMIMSAVASILSPGFLVVRRTILVRCNQKSTCIHHHLEFTTVTHALNSTVFEITGSNLDGASLHKSVEGRYWLVASAMPEAVSSSD